jgi:hypothetical protein
VGSSARLSAVPTFEQTATAVLTASPAATASPTPTFVATGSMKHGRIYATATLLGNGKVLIAGGAETIGQIETDVASAELYDPSTGSFTPTGSMALARANHTATLLNDGRVLIVGGNCSNTKTCPPDSSASAELYDPKTGKFSRTGSMSASRSWATATILPDGRVLLIGGLGASAELYNPTSGRFVRTGNSLFDTGNGSDTTTLLPDGKVLMTGKTYDGPRAEVYDPVKGKFTSIPFESPPGPAASANYNGKPFDRVAPDTATVLKDGRVLLFESGYLETYDPASGAFAPAGFMHAPGQWTFPTATLLPDGRVLFNGGDFIPILSDYTGQAASDAGTYDPATGVHLIGSMQTARLGQTATLLPDGSVLIAGGTADGENAVASAELFRP